MVPYVAPAPAVFSNTIGTADAQGPASSRASSTACAMRPATSSRGSSLLDPVCTLRASAPMAQARTSSPASESRDLASWSGSSEARLMR